MMSRPVLCFGSENPVDLVVNACRVTSFLSDVADNFHCEGPDCGLTEDGADGLAMILRVVEATLNEAVAKLSPSGH